MWTSLMEVVHRAGSAEAVRLALEKGEILARAAGFSDGRPAGPIKRHWWSEDAECRIDAASNRARFVFAQTEFSTYELLAFGIEILGAEALWPAKSTIPHAGGRDPDMTGKARRATSTRLLPTMDRCDGTRLARTPASRSTSTPSI